MSAARTPVAMPEWAVSVVPLNPPLGLPEKSEDSYELEGFVARIAKDGRRVATFMLDPSRRKKELDAALEAEGVVREASATVKRRKK